MNNDFDYDNADRKDLLERCKNFEVAVDAQHTLCMTTFKERDTYRDLCVELLEQLQYIIDSSFGNLTREDSAVSRLMIDRASEILGEKNGNAN